jgi:hypothetical protein
MDEPDSFCWDRSQPYPWASREERVVKLFDRIDHEDLDEATLLTVREEIAVLSAPVDEVTDDDRVRAGNKHPRRRSWWAGRRGRLVAGCY